MKPIAEYHDYRSYMRDFYAERKRTSAFTWREFASRAGFASPTYLKLVCDGKTKLSKPGVHKAAKAMGLEGFERVYFELLVKFCHAQTDEEKRSVFEQMNKEAERNKIRIVDADVFQYYESPVYPVVRELAPLMPGALPGEIAAKIDGEVPAQEVRDALHFLVKSDLLEKDGENYKQTSKVVKGSKEAIPLAIRAMNREMAHRAASALDKYSPDERNISGLTMGINESAYARIVAELQACRDRIIAIANECENINQVYRMNLQLFPLTSKVGEPCGSASQDLGKENQNENE